MKFNLSLFTASAVALLATANAHAAVGDTLNYQFNAPSTGTSAGAISQATLSLTETAAGVDFVLTPNWAQSTGNRVQQLQFAYSGDALSYADGPGPNASFATSVGHIDSSYTTTGVITMGWPASGAQKFDAADPSAAWSLNGSGITLDDFRIYATSPSKPSPAFGVISMPGAQPSNWVAMGEVVMNPVPEPGTYALMVAGLAAMGFVARRRQRND